MRRGVRFGVLSVWLGAAAIVLAIVATYTESLRGRGSAWLLNWLDAQGLVPPARSGGVVELTNPSALLVTDQIAIQWLLAHSVWFAVCSMLFALWAEHKRESSLYLSAGFICGSSSLVLLSPAASMLAMLLGAVFLLALCKYHAA